MTKARKCFNEQSKTCSNQNGQTTVFMAVFLTTLILVFAFSTNIGMLVHAKINLQNAADAAAFAGAAVQARQLTKAAYINYEMRRALKQYLFLYQVWGSNAQTCRPYGASGTSVGGCPPEGGADDRYSFRMYDPQDSGNLREGAGKYIPTVCIIFDEDNNYCQKNKVAGIPEFKGGGFFGAADSIIQSVRSATNIIIDKKLQDCESRTAANQLFMVAWLFNLFPNPSTIAASQDSADPFGGVQGMDRLGYFPRYAILRARLDNIEEALNLNLANEGVDQTIDDNVFDSIRARAGTDKLWYYERPMQAYLSARNNLPTEANKGIFSDVQLTELVPSNSGGGGPSDRLSNPPILAKFTDQKILMNVSNSEFKGGVIGGERGGCSQIRIISTFQNWPFGVFKGSNPVTYYAVRLQARVRLLFSPFGENGSVAISAMAAAKPFGSRIGPDLRPGDPGRFIAARGNIRPSGIGVTSSSPWFPNIMIVDEDFRAEDHGFAARGHIGYLNQVMMTQGIAQAYKLAGAYVPWEVGLYGVPGNLKTLNKFTNNPKYPGGKRWQMHAPVMPVKSQADSLAFLRDRIYSYIEGDSLTRLGDGVGPAIRNQLSDGAFDFLYAYMRENNFDQFLMIPDPILEDDPFLKTFARTSGGIRFTVAGSTNDEKRQLTSWNTKKTAQHDSSYSSSELGINYGRLGYSVKLVSFNTLVQGGPAGNDENRSQTNPFNRFSGNASDIILNMIGAIKH